MKSKNIKGITLIALVITIILLLILAGIAISMISGNNGILNKTTEAKAKTDRAAIDERVGLAVQSALSNDYEKYGKITESTLDNELKKYDIDVDLQTFDENSWTIEKDNRKYTIYSNGKFIPGDYVKSGLILWYDGINNTRSGNNPNATSWEDLSGNNNDGIFHNINTDISSITSTDKGYYSTTEKGYVFLHNDAYIESTNNIGLSGDDNYTVEVVMKPWADGTNTNYSSFAQSAPIVLGARTGTVEDTGKSAYFTYRRSTKKITYGFINNAVSTDDTFDLIDKVTSFSVRKIKTGQINTNDTDVAKIAVNGQLQTNTYNGTRSMTLNLQDSTVEIGRFWQHKNENRTFYGSIQAIRIYNRVLTDQEVNINYLLDKERFNIK